MSLLGRALLCLGGTTLYLDHGSVIAMEHDKIFVFSGGVLLLISGMRNAWFLMLQELA